MHDTALQTGQAFFQTYGNASRGTVLDVGSMDVNGTLRPYIPALMDYCGVDIASGPNVSIVLNDPHQLPFGQDSFDLVISSSCLEHDRFFWLTFSEMARVLKPGGYIYVSVPTGGVVHRYPIDAWRFYPDCGHCLAQWAEREGYPITLIESFIRPPGAEKWSDFVAVWSKRPLNPRPATRLRHRFSDAQHVIELEKI